MPENLMPNAPAPATVASPGDPETGNELADHTDHAAWLGAMLPLRLDVFRNAR